MILPILQYPAAEFALRAPCAEVTTFGTESLYALAQELLDTLAHHRGSGLAAPQIGVSQRVVAVRLDASDTGMGAGVAICCNPVILEASHPGMGREGCLSFGSVDAVVSAPSVVEASWFNTDGLEIVHVLRGLGARTFYHETGHVTGVLLVDRLKPLAKRLFLAELRRAARKVAA